MTSPSFSLRRFLPFRAAAWAVLFSMSAAVSGGVPAGAAEEQAAPAATAEESAGEEALTMSFDGALLKDVLLLFSQKTGMNFVASQDVEQKKITVYFENVSPKEALDAIMTTNNLSYTRKAGSSIYMVYAQRNEASEVVTKVFRLKYARLSSSPLDIGGQQTVKDMKTMASSSATSTSGGSDSGSSGGAPSAASSRGIDSVLRTFLSLQGKMAIDISTNSLIITDTQDTINQIQKMLVELDVPQQQVILEVHVMEIQKGLISDKGIAWGGEDGALFSVTGGERTMAAPFSGTNVLEYGGQAQVVAPADFGTATVAESLPPQMTFGTISASDFTATLHFISTDSKTKILARPRILTQNNEAAVLRLVTNTAIANQTQIVSTAGTASSSGNEAERSETGVTLRMTPQVNADNSVTLFLEPSVTTVGLSTYFPTVPFLDPTTRVVRTMARVHDNETLVIGGMIDSAEAYTKRKVPYLGDIPGIGRFFSYDAVNNSDRELVVFITPHIVQGTNSLTQKGVTSAGKDVVAKKLLDEFSDGEADIHLSAFEPAQKSLDAIGDARARRERNAAEEAGRKAADPNVDKQMGMALDAFSPQLLDDEISKALSFQTAPRTRSNNG